MLGTRETRRVAWKRSQARRHYVGYITVGDTSVRLAGLEEGTGIDAALTIPYDAIRAIRVGSAPIEEVVGERSVVLDLTDDDPIYVRPVTTGRLDLQAFARRLGAGAAV